MLKASLVIICTIMVVGNAESSCRRPGDSVDCSGLGTCVNGMCECISRSNPTEKITGKFCQCNNFGCDRHEGKVCGGKDRGVCDCGQCRCETGFLGSNCGKVDCSVGKKNCLHASSPNTSCSGNGVCNCDQCDCNTGYRGKFCEECVSCPEKCNMLSDCVRCQAFNEPDKDTCGNLKCSLNIVLVNVTEEHCHHKSSDNCYIIFSPQRDPITGAETIFVQKDKRCVKIIKKDAQKTIRLFIMFRPASFFWFLWQA
ncbi:integrin beta-2-like [Hydractinia symbiolongicarpus]|uniref:integrin beta-2-like n=1 Tax=Hydractinia symbiolongicarpus TaxID=13093 RepID=UPI002551691B|nr:integrin beta-2-like [Hydractinia symbiolongicarpus]